MVTNEENYIPESEVTEFKKPRINIALKREECIARHNNKLREILEKKMQVGEEGTTERTIEKLVNLQDSMTEAAETTLEEKEQLKHSSKFRPNQKN